MVLWSEPAVQENIGTMARLDETSRDRRRSDRTTWVGCAAYVAILGAGYYYNVTFVQLGMIDLGTGSVGLTGGRVSVAMAAFALVALASSLAAGRSMDRGGWGSTFRQRLQVLTVVTTVQLAVTVAAPNVASTAAFAAVLLASSLAIGAGIPVTFGLMSDLVPVRLRGAVAGITAGVAFAAAALYPVEWDIGEFSTVMTAAMVPAVLVLGLLAFRENRLIERLALASGRHAVGRFSDVGSLRFGTAVAVMFAVFFIDSLGFLRLVDTPTYVTTSWQSTELGVRVAIAVTHLVGAAIAGILYTNFDWRWLVLAALGLFAFSHLLYTFHIRFGSQMGAPPLVMPLTYVLAVSFYTTLNFALWPDLSTPRNAGMRIAVGVGIAGWLASFASTAAALASSANGIALVEHLTYVEALALLLVFVLPMAAFGRLVLRASRGVAV